MERIVTGSWDILVVGYKQESIFLARSAKAPTLRQTASTETEEKAPASSKKAVAVKRKPAAKTTPVPEPNWRTAVLAADSKQAKDIRAIDLREVTTFTDALVICSGGNAKQLQTIADEVETRMKEIGERPMSVEGYDNAEWILLDYGDCVVNIFSDKARSYYDLERLWRDGKPLT